MTKSFTQLYDEAVTALDTRNDDPAFTEAVHTVLTILRATGVLSYRRSKQNGYAHICFSAALVLAYEQNVAFALASRSQNSLHNGGYSTKLVEWLDRCVKEQLLLSHTDTARGPLYLGEVLNAYASKCLKALHVVQ